jgi:hypothetical protein
MSKLFKDRIEYKPFEYPEYYLEDIAKELDVPYSYLHSNGESFNKEHNVSKTLLIV